MKGFNLKFRHIAILALCFLMTIPAFAATVASDGGITLWVSWNNDDVAGASIDDAITEADGTPPQPSCVPTNTGRTDVGVPNSPPSCPATGTCTGRDKIEGDINKLADYICAASEGAHYLRRVYISDQGRAKDSADIKWNVGSGGSSAAAGGWANTHYQLSLSSAYRTCIHDVVHHELGHYFYTLPDRYRDVAIDDDANGIIELDEYYYTGTLNGSAEFGVDVVERDINTVMSNNFPHLFVDTTNARIVVDYDPPGAGNSVTGEVLTPDLLSDADPNNDGPDRAHHRFTMPFAQDEWSLLPTRHVDLTGKHTEGSFPDPGACTEVDIVFIGDDEPHPGTILLLDRSGSMGVTTSGITAAQFVQEAGMYLYHSSETGDIVGTYLYNDAVEKLFEYAAYDPTNNLPSASFRNASGLTDIAEALKEAIDELIDTHGEGGANGAEIYLMSDGRQTTGENLWDQVDRANELGIKINTFSYGDADTTTMRDIATGTSGSTTPMSERYDAFELKMLMTRKLSTGRGKTPVIAYKGPMLPRHEIDDLLHFFQGEFRVPPKSRELQFYTFLPAGDASKFRVVLNDPDGNTFLSPHSDNVATKGRFNGVRVMENPQPGLWKFTIQGSPQTPLGSEDVEIAGYVENRELTGRTWFEEFGQLRAKLHFRYPLTNLTVEANLYAYGKLLHKARLYDDGKSGGDIQSQDGIYSADIDYKLEVWSNIFRKAGFFSEVAMSRPPSDKIRVEVTFQVTEKSIPAPNAFYESGTQYSSLVKDYMRGNRSEFKAYATGLFDLGARAQQSPLQPIGKGQPKIVRVEPRDTPRVAAGDRSKLSFRLTNIRPVADQVRISLGQGVRAKVVGILKRNTYTVEYQVDEKAVHGSRTLSVQFGDTIMTWPNAIIIHD